MLLPFFILHAQVPVPQRPDFDANRSL